MPVHKPLKFKEKAKATIDTRNPQYQPSLSTYRIARHDTSKYSAEATARVDTSDPTPWKHKPRQDIDQLTEADGFLLNPRFRNLVQSNSFQSIDELRRNFCSSREHEKETTQHDETAIEKQDNN